MDDDYLDDERQPGTPSSQHALLVSALLHLMSQYALRSRSAAAGSAIDEGEAPCVKLAAVIERHLEALRRLPDAEPVLRATCEQLGDRWAELVDSRLPQRRTILERLLGRTPAYAV
jgi:hypothetical protein